MKRTGVEVTLLAPSTMNVSKGWRRWGTVSRTVTTLPLAIAVFLTKISGSVICLLRLLHFALIYFLSRASWCSISQIGMHSAGLSGCLRAFRLLLDFAAQGVIAGAYDVVVADGVEMMSRVPMRVNRMGKDNEGPLFHSRYPAGLIHQGISAELIAARWSIGREEMDVFAVASHRRAAAAEDRA